jgi:hypothetical protein
MIFLRGEHLIIPKNYKIGAYILFFCRGARNVIPNHIPKLRPCNIDAFTSNDFPPKHGTRGGALTGNIA